MSSAPLIVHIVFRFDYGGLENGLVNIINALNGHPFRHAVVALTEATTFRERLVEGVPVFALAKRPGKDFAAYVRLYRLLRTLRPAAVHTRNFGTLDCAFVALLAGVPVRIHGEHGWDVFDPDGTNRKYRVLRRALSGCVRAFITVSDDLRRWLTTVVGIPAAKVVRICNGVDTQRFHPAPHDASLLPNEIFGRDSVVVGSVARFSAIKDPMNLIEAFLRLHQDPAFATLRLLMVGDGELREAALARLRQAGAAAAAWLPGSRDDVPALLRAMDVFVLGSYREGISNTVLEAMASGLPVVATDTGGNSELVAPGTGALVPPADPAALASAIAAYARDAQMRREHGRRARERAVAEFSIAAMVESYRRFYHQTIRPVEA